MDPENSNASENPEAGPSSPGNLVMVRDDHHDTCGIQLFQVAIMQNKPSLLRHIMQVFPRVVKYINNRDVLGRTVLFQAIVKRRFDLAETLILTGANVNIPNYNRVAPLHMAVCNPKIVELLIRRGAKIDFTDVVYQTPLHYAVEGGYLDTVHVLLYYNADTTICNVKNYTPFMVALYKQDIEIQELLFEYIDDYDVVTTNGFQLTLFGLALRYGCPHSEEMIIRGADVNNTSNCANSTICLLLQSPIYNIDIFKLIWERLDYVPTTTVSCLGSLCILERGSSEFHKIIDIFIESDKFLIITDSVVSANDFAIFMVKCMEDYYLPFEKMSALFYNLLSYGYTPNDYDLMIMHAFWGHCQMFKHSIYIDVRCEWVYRSANEIATKLIYDVQYSSKELLDRLVDIVHREDYYNQNADMILFAVFRVLDYFLYPPLLKAYKMRQADCVTLKIEALPKVPSLLEIARNRSRDHIKQSYNVKDSCRMNTLINNLDVPRCCKEILTFETVIYRPTFSEEIFQKYIKIVKEINLPEEVRNRFISHTTKYSIVYY